MGLLRALAQPSTPSTREIYIIYFTESTNILQFIASRALGQVRRDELRVRTGHPDYPSREKRLQMVEVFLAANLKIAAGDPEGGIAMAREAFG